MLSLFGRTHEVLPRFESASKLVERVLNLFDINGSFLFWLEDATPAVFFEIRVVLYDVVIVRQNLIFGRFGDIVAHCFDGVIVDEQAGSYFIADGTVGRTLLVQREGVP